MRLSGEKGQRARLRPIVKRGLTFGPIADMHCRAFDSDGVPQKLARVREWSMAVLPLLSLHSASTSCTCPRPMSSIDDVDSMPLSREGYIPLRQARSPL